MQSNGCRCTKVSSGRWWQVNTTRTFQDNGWVTRYRIFGFACTPSNYYLESSPSWFRFERFVYYLPLLRLTSNCLSLSLSSRIPWEINSKRSLKIFLEKGRESEFTMKSFFEEKHKAISMWSILISYLSEGGEAAYKSDFYVDDPGSFGWTMFMHAADDA